MPQNRRRFQVKSYNEINLTNLIDTLFFLLIIFMITAPLLEYSVDVTPPEMNADPIKPDNDSKIINVKADGSIVYEVLCPIEFLQHLLAAISIVYEFLRFNHQIIHQHFVI